MVHIIYCVRLTLISFKKVGNKFIWRWEIFAKGEKFHKEIIELCEIQNQFKLKLFLREFGDCEINLITRDFSVWYRP